MVIAASSRATLESGDRLSAEAFDRIYATLHGVRAELVDGVVYVLSPVTIDDHAEPAGNLFFVVTSYRIGRPDLRSLSDGSYFTPAGDRVQPDICLFRTTRPAAAAVGDDGYLHGAPEFIAEVAASSASYDLHDKLGIYERAGVREYLVWRVKDHAFDFFRLTGSAYKRVDPDARGVFESAEFPGLRIDTAALIDGRLDLAVAALR